MLDTLRHAIDANVHGNRLLLDALRAAAEPPPKAVAAFQHILETEQTWLHRLRGEDSTHIGLWTEPDLGRCATWLDTLSAEWTAERDRLGAPELERTFSYRRNRGDSFTSTVAEVLLHALLHSAQYRGETMGLLSQAGHSVPDTDFVFYLRAIDAG